MKSRSRKEIQLSLPTSSRPAVTLLPVPGASWEVRARAHQSVLSQIPFEEGEVICSRLMRHADGVVREDYRREEWTAELAGAAMFHWKTKYRKPAPKKEPPFREEHAEDLLAELLERNDPGLVNTVYILALMLERKRLLVEQGQLQDAEGNLVRIYEKKDGGETYMIVDPRLSLDQVADVQQEVALQLGWIQPAAEAEAPESGEGVEEEGKGDESSEDRDATGESTI